MPKVEFKRRHAAAVSNAAASVSLQGQVSTRYVKKPRRVEQRAVFVGTDNEVAMLKLALYAHADGIGMHEAPAPIGGWPRQR